MMGDERVCGIAAGPFYLHKEHYERQRNSFYERPARMATPLPTGIG